MFKSCHAPALIARRGVAWTFAIRLADTPTCPICLRCLPQGDITVLHGLAVCSPCFRAGHLVSRRWHQRVRTLGLVEHFTIAAGVRWFTPQANWPARTPLHLVLGLTDGHPASLLPRRERRRNQQPTKT